MKLNQNFKYGRTPEGRLIREVISDFPLYLNAEDCGTSHEEVKQIYSEEGEKIFLVEAKKRMQQVFSDLERTKKDYDRIKDVAPDFDSDLMERLVNGFNVIREELDTLKREANKAKYAKLSEAKIENLESIAAKASLRYNLSAKLKEYEKMAEVVLKEVSALKEAGIDLSEMIPSEFSESKN